MTDSVAAHLLESTAVALAIAFIALALESRLPAAQRHTLWLVAAVQFVLPLGLIEAGGANVAAALGLVHAALPAGIDITRVTLHASAARPNISATGALWPVIVCSLWAAGTAFLVALWLWRLRAQTATALLSPAPLEQTAFEQAKHAMGGPKTVSLRVASSDSEPSARGVLRPVITIPAGLSSSVNADEMEAILVHELAHVRRRDNLSACLFP